MPKKDVGGPVEVGDEVRLLAGTPRNRRDRFVVFKIYETPAGKTIFDSYSKERKVSTFYIEDVVVTRKAVKDFSEDHSNSTPTRIKRKR